MRKPRKKREIVENLVTGSTEDEIKPFNYIAPIPPEPDVTKQELREALALAPSDGLPSTWPEMEQWHKQEMQFRNALRRLAE